MLGSPQDWALRLAAAVSTASEDPYCQVGAVVVSRARIVLATGYNGPPSGVHIDMADRAARRPFMIHAESNALRYCTPEQASGGLLAVTHQPCAPCVNLASAYGIRAIVFSVPPADPDRYPIEPALQVARLARIRLEHITQEEER